MRAAVSLLVCALLLAPAAAAPPAVDTLIVPGVRVGKWTLKMTIDDLVRTNGPARTQFVAAGSALDLSARQNYSLYEWLSLSLAAETFDRRKVEVLVAGILAGTVPYKTDRGIALLGGNRADILKVYGKPTVALRGTRGQSELLYDKIGLGFRVFDDGGRIRLVYVFAPGTAKKAWKF